MPSAMFPPALYTLLSPMMCHFLSFFLFILELKYVKGCVCSACAAVSLSLSGLQLTSLSLSLSLSLSPCLSPDDLRNFVKAEFSFCSDKEMACPKMVAKDCLFPF